MKHAHSKLIEAWNNDNSVRFEFAYGSGADFTWHECDIKYVIENPHAQVRIKDVVEAEIYDEWKFKSILSSHGIENEELLTKLNKHMDKFAEEYMCDKKETEKAVLRRVRCFIMQKQIELGDKGESHPLLNEIVETLGGD